MGSRRILSPLDSPTPDDYKTRLLKSIPADVVAAWVFLDGILSADPLAPDGLHWAVFAAVLALTPLWTWSMAYEPGLPTPTLQIVASTLAFAVWAFALGGPFDDLAWYTSSLASVILALYTLAAPLLPFLTERWAHRLHAPGRRPGSAS